MTSTTATAQTALLPHSTGPRASILHSQGTTLLDVLDRVIDKGVVVDGELILQVADIELVNVGLKLVLSSTERMKGLRSGKYVLSKEELIREKAELKALEKNLERAVKLVPATVNADSPQKAEHGLAKLVLTLVELIRKLMERQAMRRIAGGSLTSFEVERLGLTFAALERKMEELKQVFGIKDHELNLELGPIGDLM